MGRKAEGEEVLEVLTDLLRSWAGVPGTPHGSGVSLRAAELKGSQGSSSEGKIAGAYLPAHLGEGGQSRGEQTHKPQDYQESQFASQH